MAITVNQKSSRTVKPATGSIAEVVSRRAKEIPSFFEKKVGQGEVTFFLSQLSLMLEIGTPLKNSLEALEEQTENPAFKKVIQSMIRDIAEGRQFSDAMGHHPKVFNNVITSMIKAGETGGFLSMIIDRIVEMRENRAALVNQIRSALTYPMVLCGLGVLVIIFVLVGVLPKFTAFFEGKEAVLPLTTRFMMATSASLRSYWYLYIIGTVGAIVGIKFYKASEQGQSLRDWLLVNVPIISRLSNKINTCEMLRILGHLMESQVPLLQALEVTRGTMKNRYFRGLLDQITDHVQQGGKFSQPFGDYPFIMESVKQMVATGEEAGNLSTVMLRLSVFYDEEVDRELKTVSSLIEPMALIVMGAVVGLVVASVVLPLFKLAQALH